MPLYDLSTHIVFLDLPLETAQAIDELRKEVNPAGVQRWAAHITLKQDADYMGTTTELMNRLEDFCSIIRPLPLTLDGLQIREEADGESWSIYVAIQEKSLLHAHIKTLSKLLMPLTTANSKQEQSNLVWEQTDDYYPHISIVGGKGITKGRQLLDELKIKYNPTGKQIICSSVTLTQWHMTKWEKVHTFSLTLA